MVKLPPEQVTLGSIIMYSFLVVIDLKQSSLPLMLGNSFGFRLIPNRTKAPSSANELLF
jgi:hypothetical protein